MSHEDTDEIEDLHSRIDNLTNRVERLEEFVEVAENVEVGDEKRVVIIDPNYGDGDPYTQIRGVATFVRCPDDFQPGLRESVHVTIADIQPGGPIIAVADPEK